MSKKRFFFAFLFISFFPFWLKAERVLEPIQGVVILERGDLVLYKTIKEIVKSSLLQKGVKIKLAKIKEVPKRLPAQIDFIKLIEERLDSDFLLLVFREGGKFFTIFKVRGSDDYVLKVVKLSLVQFKAYIGNYFAKLLSSFIKNKRVVINYKYKKEEKKKRLKRSRFLASISYIGLFPEKSFSLSHGIEIEGAYNIKRELLLFLSLTWYLDYTIKRENIELSIMNLPISLGISYERRTKKNIIFSIYGAILALYSSKECKALKETVIPADNSSFWTLGIELGLKVEYIFSNKGRVFLGGGSYFLFSTKRYIFIEEDEKLTTIFEPSKLQPFFTIGIIFYL